MTQATSGRIRLELYLKDVYYPANKLELMDRAEDTNAPPEILEKLNRLPDRNYLSLDDLRFEMNRLR